MAPTNEQLCSSGFKRILIRLDEATRRKYCCQAIEEDLTQVANQMQACEAAMVEVKQVQDATRKVYASQRAIVSSELLTELETLANEIEVSVTKLLQNGSIHRGTTDPKATIKAQGVDNSDVMTIQEAKRLSRKILQTQELETAVNGIKQLQRTMAVVIDVQIQSWWKKSVLKVVDHAINLLTDNDKDRRLVRRLEKTLVKVKNTYPELKSWHFNVRTQIAAKVQVKPDLPVKNKKERIIVLPNEGETATTKSSLSTRQSKDICSNKKKKKKSASAEKVQSLLQRCSREVRTLRDKFDLGTYDKSLSQIVTIVDSPWLESEPSEVSLLTTALLTLVETAEKIVDQVKRRDRLVCLQSVLGIVLGSSKLHLTMRRKMMLEEYANNCRQSLEQLSCRTDSGEATSASNVIQQASAQETPSITTRGKLTGAGIVTRRPKSHVRFG